MASHSVENTNSNAFTQRRRSPRINCGTPQRLVTVQAQINDSIKKFERTNEDQLLKPSCINSNSRLHASRTVDDTISPVLSRLRNTPAHEGLKFKRRILETKHEEARSKADKTVVGGGVSMWPNMQNMRLTPSQAVKLILLNICLVPVTIWIFYLLHGQLVFSMLEFTDKLKVFPSQNTIRVHHDSVTFNADVRHWHTSLLTLMSAVHEQFDVTLTKASLSYKLFVVLYCCGVATLLYFLLDNVLAKSKLSPRRIQQWVSLLTVVGLWTLLSIKLLVLAQRLEQSVVDVVHSLNHYLADLVCTSHDMTSYERVLLYWRTRCLPPTSRGTLTVMGVLTLQDVMYYLQYYSLPIVTALLSPVIKLVVSLKEIYSPNELSKES